MPIAVVIPKMGMTMAEATVTTLMIAEGDEVRSGQVLLTITTDKLEADVEAEASGRVAWAAGPGDVLEPGDVVGWILGPEESASGMPLPSQVPRAVKDEELPPTTGAAPPPARRTPASPLARRLAADAGINLVEVVGRGPGGRVLAADVEDHRRSLSSQSRPQLAAPDATFAAVELAAQLNMNLADVVGSDVGGRIRRSDVAAQARSSQRTDLSPSIGYAQPDNADPTSVPLAGIRRAIAQRMFTSLREMAQYTLTTTVDAGPLLALRSQLQGGQTAPTITDAVVKAAAVALRSHPRLNAEIRDDEILMLRRRNIGLAVALDEGIVVPVIQDADLVSLLELADISRQLVEDARAGRLRPADVEGATFCVSALGQFGIDAFTPVVNPANVGILGIGAVRDSITWSGSGPQPSATLTLSLTVDHRAVDGVPGARYLRDVCELLKRPAQLLSPLGSVSAAVSP